MVPIRTALLTALVILGLRGIAVGEPVPVSPSDLAKCEKGFGALQQSTRTFSADIVQTLFLQGLAQPIVSRGALFYAAPDRLLIRFSQPAGEWMLVHGAQSAVKKQGKPLELRDLSSSNSKSSHAANLLDFFRSGPDHWHRDFDVSMTQEGDQVLVHLKPWMTPTTTFQGVESIITTLQLPSYELVSMEITLSGSNRVSYEFSHPRRNLDLAPSLFDLPKDAAP